MPPFLSMIINVITDNSLIIFKLCCSAINFLAIYLVGVYVVHALKKKEHGEKLIHVGSHFAAGVFLGFATIHLLGFSDGIISLVIDKNYPRAFALVFAGHMMSMMVDFIVRYAFVWFSRKAHPKKIPGMKQMTSSDTTSLTDPLQSESQECDVLYRSSLLG